MRTRISLTLRERSLSISRLMNLLHRSNCKILNFKAKMDLKTEEYAIIFIVSCNERMLQQLTSNINNMIGVTNLKVYKDEFNKSKRKVLSLADQL